MNKQTKENIQLYVLTTMLFGCMALPFVSAFQSSIKKEHDNKYVVKTKAGDKPVNPDSLKIDSTSFYKHYLQNQRY